MTVVPSTHPGLSFCPMTSSLSTCPASRGGPGGPVGVQSTEQVRAAWSCRLTVEMAPFTSPTGGGFKLNEGLHFDLIIRNRTIGCLPLHSMSPQRPMGEVFEIEIDTLETTCHVLDPTPLANCSVRQLTEHVSGTLRVIAGGGRGGWPSHFHHGSAESRPIFQLPSWPLWPASVHFLELSFEASFPRADLLPQFNLLIVSLPQPECNGPYCPVKVILWGSPLTTMPEGPTPLGGEKQRVSPPPGYSLWVYSCRLWKEIVISVCWSRTASFLCFMQNVIPVQVEMILLILFDLVERVRKEPALLSTWAVLDPLMVRKRRNQISWVLGF